ncbi:MAG: hypothetical protein U1F43_27270 [Myxococcota bacterium]
MPPLTPLGARRSRARAAWAIGACALAACDGPEGILVDDRDVTTLAGEVITAPLGPSLVSSPSAPLLPSAAMPAAPAPRRGPTHLAAQPARSWLPPPPALPARGGPRSARLVFAPASPGGYSQPATPLAPSGDGQGPRRAVLDLVVNGLTIGDVDVVIDGRDVRVRLDDLRRAGIVAHVRSEQGVEGPAWVSLIQLGDHATFVLDEATLALRIDARPELFEPSFISLAPGRPAGIVQYRDTSAFLNYGVRLDDDGHLSGSSEIGARFGDALLVTAARASTRGEVVRGLSQLVIDDVPGLRRWTFGDAFASTGPLGGGTFLGGVTVERTLALDPYLPHTPGLDFEDAVTTPSTLDVYVDGALVSRTQIPVGAFRVSDLAVPSGSGSARYVLTDALGRQRSTTRSFYVGGGLLAPGLDLYSASVGLARKDLAHQSFDYHQPVASAWHRHGVSRVATVGWRAEAAPLRRYAGLGPSLAVALPAGTVELGLGGSVARGRFGGAAYLAYDYAGRGLGGSLYAALRTPGYATLGVDPSEDRRLVDVGASASWSQGKLRVTVSGRAAQSRDHGWSWGGTVGASLALMPSLALGVSGDVSGRDGAPNAVAYGVVLSFTPGTGYSASAAEHFGSSGPETALSASVPVRDTGDGTAVGVHAHALLGERPRIQLNPQVVARDGRLDAALVYDDQGFGGALEAAGGLVWIDGTPVLATRPVGDAFAIITVPDGVEARAFRDHREIGRTSDGALVIPDLLPYYANRLGLAVSDLGLDFEISDAERLVSPAFRGGAHVRFGVVATAYLRGHVVLVGGAPDALAYATFVVATDDDPTTPSVSSPVGAGGEIELHGIEPGDHTATVSRGSELVCRVAFSVLDGIGPIQELGLLACHAPAAPETP